GRALQPGAHGRSMGRSSVARGALYRQNPRALSRVRAQGPLTHPGQNAPGEERGRNRGAAQVLRAGGARPDGGHALHPAGTVRVRTLGPRPLRVHAQWRAGRSLLCPHGGREERLHAAQSQLKDGEMLLLDYAPEFHYYQADVTRMWPVNGKFSPQQRELYGFYLGCYQAIMKHIRPRMPVSTIGQEAAREMEALLARSKFSNSRHQDAAKQFVAT